MTISTVTVSIAANMITGAALPYGRVVFELTAADIDASIIAPAPTTVTLDANGVGTIALWPNAAGTQGTQYRVTIYSQGGDLQFCGLATVPESNCNLYAVLNLDAPAMVSDVSAHIADTTDAHDASAISVAAISGIAATNVQTAIAELKGDIDGLVVGSGATNLAYTASPTNGIVTSDTGNDATLPLADGTNAGLMAPAQHTKLAGISGTNTGDQDLSGYATTAAVSSAIGVHSGATDPHGDRSYADGAIGTHAGATDPHGDRAFATSAVNTHAAATDPHGDRAYADSLSTTPGGSTTQVQFNDGGAFGGHAGLVYRKSVGAGVLDIGTGFTCNLGSNEQEVSVNYFIAGFTFSANGGIVWGPVAQNGANQDVGIKRNGVGVAEINSGTPGTFRDLMLRNLISSGGVITPSQYTNATEPSFVNGNVFFNTDLDKLRVGGASAWETVTST